MPGEVPAEDRHRHYREYTDRSGGEQRDGPCDTLRTVSASPFLSVALDAARGAGRLLRDALGGTRRIRHKRSVIDLVTEMDQHAEAFIVERLRGAFPDHAVLAEESGATDGRSPYRWLIDPLAGTTNYADSLPSLPVP